MIHVIDEVAIKQEILEISFSSLPISCPTSNSDGSGKKKRRAVPEKRTMGMKTPKKTTKTAPKLGSPSVHPSTLSHKLTVAQKDALSLAFTGHNSVPSLASRNAWASANNVKGDAVHRYCRYLRDRSKQKLFKQEPDAEPRVEAEWHLAVIVHTSAEGEGIQSERAEAPAPVFQTSVSKSHQPDILANLNPLTTAQLQAVSPSEHPLDPISYPPTLEFALESPQVPDFSFLLDARFFDLLTGPESITYDDLHDPIMFCMKFQDSLCSLDMEVAYEALRTMYFFEGGTAG
jgi:hypothetical protein